MNIRRIIKEKLQECLNKLNEEGADTSWTDIDKQTITLQDILELTKDIKIQNFPTKELALIVLNWDNNPEEIERISQVEISSQYPILIMVDEQGKIQWILDGNHRAQKALSAKVKTIPAKLIKPSDLNSKARKILLNIIDEHINSQKEVSDHQSGKKGSGFALLQETIRRISRKETNPKQDLYYEFKCTDADEDGIFYDTCFGEIDSTEFGQFIDDMENYEISKEEFKDKFTLTKSIKKIINNSESEEWLEFYDKSEEDGYVVIFDGDIHYIYSV